MPIYFMTCFFLDEMGHTHNRLHETSFLWGKNDEVSRGVSLINWNTVCMLREWEGHGGTSIRDA